jgi:hypothetical protein
LPAAVRTGMQVLLFGEVTMVGTIEDSLRRGHVVRKTAA